MTDLEQQIADLDAIIDANPADADALYRRGSLNWRLGRRARALTDLNRAADLNPDGPAPTAVAHLNAILDFCDPDLYNP